MSIVGKLKTLALYIYLIIFFVHFTMPYMYSVSTLLFHIISRVCYFLIFLALFRALRCLLTRIRARALPTLTAETFTDKKLELQLGITSQNGIYMYEYMYTLSGVIYKKLFVPNFHEANLCPRSSSN